ncbi:MAG: hypothetical protein KDA27_02150 [Candidatus Eisenbacteria bacterium]|uniref:Uncharacterized protein n=1 Tax=Eiseniibacteriota bacterium TaxID=2212470 RepID=A0A956NA61_UNCEI|nr:hypothetical protein [Candidatus Eisenbacteria bacterium]MCB9463454.1 hypothetical protein [Candidatus Eisenbacteria bacterium]
MDRNMKMKDATQLAGGWNRRDRRWAWVGTFVALAVTGLLVLSLGVAQADPPSKKAQREIRMFERVMDDMLIDSPNWLVPGRDNTRGYYVAGHGVIYTFQASLVDRDWGRKFRFNVGWWDDDDWRDRRDRRERDRDDKDESRRDRYTDREERLFERGKQEVFDLLYDFGDTMESIGANETVTVVACLGDDDLFWDRDIRTLEMTVKISDLRAAANGSVSEDDFAKRVQIQEY